MDFYYLRNDGFIKSGLVNRKGWDSGLWDSEPDYKYWMSHGFDCVILRNEFGSWCGYVGVGSGHPCYEEYYQDIDQHGLQVHGGITYADSSMDDPIREIPIAGKTVWWIGFSCNGFRDTNPGFPKLPGIPSAPPIPGQSYKTMQYIIDQADSLAKQLRVLQP